MTPLYALAYSDTHYLVIQDRLITNIYADDFREGMSVESFCNGLVGALEAVGVAARIVRLDANGFFAEHLGLEADGEGYFLEEWLEKNPAELEPSVRQGQSASRQSLCAQAHEMLRVWVDCRAWLTAPRADLGGVTPLDYAVSDERVNQVLRLLMGER